MRNEKVHDALLVDCPMSPALAGSECLLGWCATRNLGCRFACPGLLGGRLGFQPALIGCSLGEVCLNTHPSHLRWLSKSLAMAV